VEKAITNTITTMQKYTNRIFLLLSIVALHPQTTKTQALTNGKILFYTFDGFEDLRACA
jgi:hypothetical protein